MDSQNKHIVSIRLPEIFSKKTFKIYDGGSFNLPGSGSLDIPETVIINAAKITGREREQDELLVQSLVFSADHWTEETAKNWLKENRVENISFETIINQKVMKEKELLLYTSIYGNTAQILIEKMSEIPPDENFTIRLNCPGGSVFAGYGILAKMREHKGRIKIKVDGHAASFGAFMLLYADEVECINLAQFMFHRAGGYVENEDDQKLLDSVNADIQKGLKQRLNADKFKEISNLTIDDMFNADKRRDLWFNAKEAKEIGLVNKITRIKPTEIDQLSNKMVAFADFQNVIEPRVSEEIIKKVEPRVSDSKSDNNINKNDKKMTLDEFLTAHPALHREIKNAAFAEGVKAENVRVKSLLAFLNYDNENVLKMVKEGTEFTTDIQAELLTKMTAKVEAKNIESDNTEGQETGSTLTPEELKQAQIDAETKEVLSKL